MSTITDYRAPVGTVTAARCPALFIAAPASGQGKTTVTAALARLHVRLGRTVRVFKCGPDFLDPQIHAVASAAPVHNVDLGMCGEADIAWRLHAAAQEADLILVEGVMGLYDGAPSGADIARRFGIPVMAVIDARAMAQTFGAVAFGLAHYEPGLAFAGVLANHVGSAYHAELLRQAVPDGMRWFGALMRDADAALPERHLGLMQAAEIADLDLRLDRLADHLQSTGAAELPPAVNFPPVFAPALAPLLAGKRIAIARDAAYGFIYPANLDTLQALGAELVFFSPLAGDGLPENSDAVWLPGGYPELHGDQLAANVALWSGLRAHVAAGKPVLAECGGLMSLLDSIVEQGRRRPCLRRSAARARTDATAPCRAGHAACQLGARAAERTQLPLLQDRNVACAVFARAASRWPRGRGGVPGRLDHRVLRPLLVSVQSGGSGGIARRSG